MKKLINSNNLNDERTVASGKRPGALRTIGEVCEALGLRAHVLRYWETQFPMLQPVKRSGARRYYRPEDIALLTRIDELVHRQGYTLRGACQLLEQESRGDGSSAQSKAAPKPRVSTDDSLHESLKNLRSRLARELARSE